MSTINISALQYALLSFIWTYLIKYYLLFSYSIINIRPTVEPKDVCKASAIVLESFCTKFSLRFTTVGTNLCSAVDALVLTGAGSSDIYIWSGLPPDITIWIKKKVVTRLLKLNTKDQRSIVGSDRQRK